jgi:hypothetical protein
VRFEVLTVTNMQMAVFWDVALCSLVDVSEELTAVICPATSQKTAIFNLC